ncbi:hypothetical protein MNBD_GAMMA09-1838 [hydrothermal vent metagenome]|uniref:HTH merR-type domain-containing protein n=1 Tax=hydrothermal vent metagenome TaxID=652676 RepID=A0A3B0YIK8_9ZZZZ
MMTEKQYTLDELSILVDISKRTIRYYIQQQLVNRPDGEKRGSHYTQVHLEQLLEIKKWQKEGLSLERIKSLLGVNPDTSRITPATTQQPGDISVWSRIFINDGIEIQIDPIKADMTAEELRTLVTQVTGLYHKIKMERK